MYIYVGITLNAICNESALILYIAAVLSFEHLRPADIAQASNAVDGDDDVENPEDDLDYHS